MGPLWLYFCRGLLPSILTLSHVWIYSHEIFDQLEIPGDSSKPIHIVGLHRYPLLPEEILCWFGAAVLGRGNWRVRTSKTGPPIWQLAHVWVACWAGGFWNSWPMVSTFWSKWLKLIFILYFILTVPLANESFQFVAFGIHDAESWRLLQKQTFS